MRVREHGNPVYEISEGAVRPRPVFATYADGAIGLRHGSCGGFVQLSREEIAQVRARRDGLAFRTRTGAWYRAHFDLGHIAAATAALARAGLVVDAA